MRYLLMWFSYQRWQQKNTDLAKANAIASKVIFAFVCFLIDFYQQWRIVFSLVVSETMLAYPDNAST